MLPDQDYLELRPAAGEVLVRSQELAGQAFVFGVSLTPISLTILGEPGTSRHAALRADFRRLNAAAAETLLVDRIAQRAVSTVAAGSGRMARAYAALDRLQAQLGGVGLLAAPRVRAALKHALMATSGAPAPTPTPELDDVGELRRQLAALTARLARLETQGTTP